MPTKPPSKPATNTAMSPSDWPKFLGDLAELMENSALTELELEDESKAVRLSTRPSDQPAAGYAMPVATTAATAPSPPVAAAPSPAATDTNPDTADIQGAIRSPMVGTVYLAPEPGAPNFVSEGDQVKNGQTLLIIEAMKVMNPITATKAGVVKKVLVENAQPVEFDQPLIAID